jgi:hypothetical protein
VNGRGGRRGARALAAARSGKGRGGGRRGGVGPAWQGERGTPPSPAARAVGPRLDLFGQPSG